jgi:hypothetical protein
MNLYRYTELSLAMLQSVVRFKVGEQAARKGGFEKTSSANK